MLITEAFFKVIDSKEDIYFPAENKKQQELLRVGIYWQRKKLPMNIQQQIAITKVSLEGKLFVKVYYKSLWEALVMKDGELLPAEEEVKKEERSEEDEIKRITRFLLIEGKSEEEIQQYIQEYKESLEIAKLGDDQ